MDFSGENFFSRAKVPISPEEGTFLGQKFGFLGRKLFFGRAGSFLLGFLSHAEGRSFESFSRRQVQLCDSTAQPYYSDQVFDPADSTQRTAYRINSAAVFSFSFALTLIRWTSTVLALTRICSAISFVLNPSPM